ncbi:type II and III secretion system protein family protein [Pelagerythrobacter rhizovicinus]|uniref:Type II and III secretion system protein family protein n=1 Tax=Pelagerythrobacter rhizovicinus TaxID=2268576 RepID=A0A4Q2KKR8_9SPHN|nr:type II and III secretion system protein family protein [Pelagerythrobacter rhizovicinus]RXZ65009.1 type II and III secretion system protein family protein [Pelagerythrobacter rhizovicinus]
MKRRLLATALFAGAALAPIGSLPVTVANAQTVSTPSQSIVLSIGRGELVSVPGTMADVFVANEAVADVQVKSQRQLFVLGKSGGETTIYASNAAGDVIWSANVRVGSNIDSIPQMLALAMPEAQISTATMGTNTVLLTGTVAAPEDAAEAERLVQAFVGDEMNVISRLKMATPLQVNLQVRFAEVSRSLVRAIGANLASFDGTNGFKFGVTTGRSPFPQYAPGGGVFTGVTEATEGTSVVTGMEGGTTIAGFGRFLGLDLAGALDLAERNGLLTTLSQPNLTALSGETAEFLAGGEFPIPISQGLGTTAIEYRQFGVSLAYTPVVLANGRISIRVRPEVSELSSQGAVMMDNFQIPALTIRRAETTVELGSGQSFMIAGLMSNSAQNSIDKAPGLGDVPILGNLFRSRQFRKGETELVIVVTPYLVNPVDANDIALPTDGFHAANELEGLLGYRENAGVSGEQRPAPRAVDREAPQPGVSRIDPQAVLPGSSGRAQRQAESATPGFSLK